MSTDASPPLLTLEDLLPSGLTDHLQSLSPGIAWALDALVVSFGGEIQNLDEAAREAFARLTLHYGENLDQFLELARQSVDEADLRERNRKISLLHTLDIFSELNTFDLGQIAGAFEPVTYPPGAVLAEQGAEGHAVFLLEKGRVGIVVEGNQVAVRGEGTLFGETSCITGDPVNATLKAVDECRVLEISRQNFENLVLKLPQIVPKIARIGFTRLDEATHRLSEVLSHIPDALLKIDRHGVITGDISSKCFTILGQDVLTGRRFCEMFFKNDAERQRQWDEALPSLWEDPERIHDPGFPLPRQAEIRVNSAEMRHYRVNLFPCLRRGRQEGFDVAISDLTEQKRVEEERERMERALRQVKRQFVMFGLAGESFGLEIESVMEIIESPHVTPLPNAPPFVKGFFNLRSRVVPAIDLGVLLGLPRGRQGARGCIFIVEVQAREKKTLAGLMADTVEEILEVFENDIEDAREMGATLGEVGFIQGMAKVGGEVRLLLNVQALLSEEQHTLVSSLGEGVKARE